MREINGMVPLKDIALEAGYESRAASVFLQPILKQLGIQVERRKVKQQRGPPMICVPQEDAATVLEILRDRKSKYLGRRGVDTLPKVTPAPRLKPPRQEPAPEPPRSIESEFVETCRKLVHLCAKLDDDREVTVTKNGAEVVRTISVSKQETIKP